MNLLVSLHLPKTAGSSFSQTLKACFGNGYVGDYTDLPMNTGIASRHSRALLNSFKNCLVLDSSARCIHGHFLPLKYRFLRDAKHITWMRDPAERMASHYHYWKRAYRPGKSGKCHAMVVEGEWTLEQFCLSNEFRNIYSQFLWGFPFDGFDFVGITEYYKPDLIYFYQYVLGVDVPVFNTQVNVNAEKDAASYFNDNAFRDAVVAFHAKDYALYNKALEKRLGNDLRVRLCA